MENAQLYTKVQITLTINQRIDAREYQDSELLEDWIYCNVTDHNSEWLDIKILSEELSDFSQ